MYNNQEVQFWVWMKGHIVPYHSFLRHTQKKPVVGVNANLKIKLQLNTAQLCSQIKGTEDAPSRAALQRQ